MDFSKHAADITETYKANEKIASILIAGSVSRGWNDEHSDIEIYVLWNEEPSDEDRLAPIRKVSGKVIDFYPFEENEWSETYVAGGVKFEMSHFLVSYLEEMTADVIGNCDTDKDKQCLLAGIQDGIILYGEESANVLKDKVNPYPESLGKQVVMENLELSSRWNSRYILADREDIFILHEVLSEAVGKVLEMLHGVNRIYIGHPKLKWIKQTVNKMGKAPQNLVDRIRRIYRDPSVSGIRDLENILLETYSIIEETYPEINVKEFREKLLFTRPTHA